jgi:hypothetical protein
MKQLTTPIGKALYPKLVTPDTKFNAAGVYSVTLVLTKEDYETLEAQIKPWLNSEYERLLKESGRKELHRTKNTPLRITDDGEYVLLAKQTATKEHPTRGLLKFDIVLYDSQGRKINNPPNIGSGTTMKLGVQPSAWFVPSQGFGYTLRLKAAQIIDLVEYNSGGGGFAFDAEDGSFVSEDLDDAFDNDSKDASVPF